MSIDKPAGKTGKKTLTTRGRMGRIQQLPTPIKDKIDEMLRENVSQTEIIRRLDQPLRDAGEKPLAAATLNRYATRMENFGQRIRESREIAKVWVAKFGEEPAGEVGQLTIEMLRTLAFELAARARDMMDESDEPSIDPAMINELALAIQRLERAAEIGAKRERSIRAEIAAQAETVAKKAGISADTAAAIRAALTRIDEQG